MSIRKSYSRRQILRALGFGAGATALAACTTGPTKASQGTGDPIADGINKFEDSIYPDNKKLYEDMADSQSPHTLVVTCSDSRIDAETLLSAKPGELFHLRNIANIVPHASKPDFGMLAPVEYAVASLEVSTIAVIGHSNCGGMAALQHLDDYAKKLPATHDWLTRSKDVLARLEGERKAEDFSLRLERANAAAQLENLMSHPFVSDRVNAGALKLEAYHYDIGKGDVTKFDQKKGIFVDA
ncbi:carbonic anhydrase [Corynebacterium pseudotuberculosis 258]|uniref:carbonic anhydrase n=1 Tax=Corynebacterium pseudotuberculosis 258 TaxID=1168865 RepID=A0AAU8PK51_CORPS|nr:carbonic anhydrase [Corynebacterium pseudotuberculosis]AEQ06141.1 carbonic anhydrase [Corynebacterium pseudotuberculosis CIP 52.97]AFK16229.1 carbonic anhydrase [Corynebacterium pseudotuberculosis 258]